MARGIQLYADFYCFSQCRDDSTESREIESWLLPRVKEELLLDVYLCVLSEFKHLVYRTKIRGPITLLVWKRFMGSLAYDAYLWGSKRRIDNVDEMSRYLIEGGLEGCFLVYDWLNKNKVEPNCMRMMELLFGSPNLEWQPLYGGHAWAKICKGWLALYNAKTAYENDIDHLIDLCHNTGAVLNKIYPRIQRWLYLKTHTQNPYWIVEQSSLKRWARRQMRKKLGWALDQYQVGLYKEEYSDWRESI